jgi:2-polyprenyl-3-methyl-5-hydroxy-6-metoxy-1,4-benzoquinol methylase
VAPTARAQIRFQEETNMDMNKLQDFVGKVVGDVGAAMASVLVAIGDRLGLWKALTEGPATPAELAKRSGCAERYLREWLDAQAASGYVTYDASTGRYTLPEEQAFALANSESPAYVVGMFQIVQAMWAAQPRLEERFKTGAGLQWGEHHPCLFQGTERFFRSGYIAHLVTEWLPALDGVTRKLADGARVADVGCGLGASTILMAKAYPNSKFWGFDSHAASIDTARLRAREAGVADRVTFEVATSTNYPGAGYDLVAHFDCLHDMENPVEAARHARRTLAADGTWMVVEPFAHDQAERNHNPVGRVFYSASTMLCVPHSLSLKGPALGAQAGEARLRDVIVSGGGFSKMRRATETPFNIVLEARP